MPLYEGRFGHQFNHRYAEQPDGVLRELTEVEREERNRLVMPQYWVEQGRVDERLSRHQHACRTGLLGHRRVARDTDERTAIAAVLPYGAVSYGWILTLGPPAQDLCVLAAIYNSFAFDYLLRNALSQPSIPQGTFAQIACPGPDQIPKEIAPALAAAVRRLVCTANDLQDFGNDCRRGTQGKVLPLAHEMARAWIDGVVFHLYGIEEPEVDRIMETFPIVKRRDVLMHGDYKTKRLILEQHDRLKETMGLIGSPRSRPPA